jgi:hypothetical protein
MLAISAAKVNEVSENVLVRCQNQKESSHEVAHFRHCGESTAFSALHGAKTKIVCEKLGKICKVSRSVQIVFHLRFPGANIMVSSYSTVFRSMDGITIERQTENNQDKIIRTGAV